MMILFVYRLDATRKLAIFESPVTLRLAIFPFVMFAVEMLALEILAEDMNALDDTLRYVTFAWVETLRDCTFIVGAFTFVDAVRVLTDATFAPTMAP
jgi:hypothetical protein